MCESYNLQYGTNFISVMPTNLYGPNDNFDLEKSHVLPALLRKTILGEALRAGDMETIRKDLTKLPIAGVDGTATDSDIHAILSSYGIVKDSQGNVTVEIWGSGKPMREFLWSEDMADACVFIMQERDFKDTYKEKTEIRNTHINIGTGIDISIKDLAALIKQKTNYQGQYIFNTEKPDGTMKKLTDVRKLNDLGWKHTVDLEKGIELVNSWYKK
jgi:GDP-L-fucose synthase